ncbi:membrane cofactor protein-like isoform X2 [Eptesicus fuscus]|uniref:membrane cofactor protein-like isoform X2 n=1 Tax=Eptesicus fuscus TaxID=29078 RepID=UPI00240400B9|nr:membrane cofactor protein-like isoform X2 [Eptesicus fuscus]
MSGSMRASYQPLRASSRRLESPFSWGFLGVLLLALELLLPMCSDACGDPPRYQTMKPQGDPAPPYNAGFTVDYECRPGYRLIVPLVRPTTSVCQPDGTWAPPLREACTIKACPQMQEPQNGKLTYIGGASSLGSQAQFVCNKGYYLVGTKILKCELSGNDVTWSGDPPSCEKILCKPPQKIPNGEFTNSHKDTFEYNEVVTYTCKPLNRTDQYSLVGESRLICSGLNRWSSDPPECKVVKCEYPVLKNGKLVSGFGKTFLFKAKVTFECLNGFYLEGSSTIVCGADSTWGPKIPKCIKDGGLIAVIVLTVFGVAVVGTCV